MINVITCFGPGGWDLYAKRMVDSFIEFWPKDVKLTVYYHDCEGPDDLGRYNSHNVSFINLNEVDENFIKFRTKAATANGMSPDGKYNYRFDALKFSAKVFAVGHLLSTTPENDLVIWLDADTFTHAPVDHDWLNQIAPDNADIVCLRRTGLPYSETAYVAIRNRGRVLFVDMVDMYVDGEIFTYIEHHDGFVFERLLYLHSLHGLEAFSLTPEGYTGLEAFENSILAEKMHHLKGNKKNQQVQCYSRYDQLNELVKFYAQGKSTYTILETGTWNGGRAVQLANAAFAAGVQEVVYYGYDLFEDATQESDTLEFNTKSHNTREEVSARLAEFQKAAATHGRKFSYILTKGDTKKTLKSATNVDFAWLDGGHSFESAQHDYTVCKEVPVIVFDDYITPDAKGVSQPKEHLGTNQVVDSLTNCKKHIFESNDPVTSGGITHIALILPLMSKEPPALPISKEPANPGWKPMVVTPHDCVDESNLIDNVEKNLAMVSKWAPACRPHEGSLIVASAGPSLVENLNKIKELQEQGALVMAVKHALPMLKEAGILPWGLVVLDPRPIQGISTHGVKRKDLFEDVPDGTKCFVASMTDPDVTKYLLDRGLDVIGWHAYTKGLAEYKKWPSGTHLITGGTCSAWRSVGLGSHLGFSEFHLFGMDFSFRPGTVDMSAKDEEGRQKYFTVSPDQGKTKYISTGELIAAAQDTQQIFSMVQAQGMELIMYGDGFGQHLWRSAFENKDQTRKRFEEVYGHSLHR